MQIPSIHEIIPARFGRVWGCKLAAVMVLAIAAACSGAPRAEAPDPKAAPLVQLAAAADVGLLSDASPYGDFLAARHAERRNDYDRAATLFARSLAHAPDNPALMRQTLHQMLAAGRLKDAAKIARRYLKHEPNSVIAGLLLAVMDIQAGRAPAAAKRLAKIPARGLGGYFVPLTMAWTQMALSDSEAALKALAPLAKLRGGRPFHDYHAALILDFAGDAAKARVYFDKLGTDGFASYVRIVELAGDFYRRQGDVEVARKTYDQFLKRRPGSSVIKAAGDALAAGRPAPRQIASAADGVSEAMFNLGTLLSQENVPEIAMMLTQMALKLRQGFDMAELLRGDILESTGRTQDAITAYERISRASPLAWSARLRSAQLLDRIGKSEVAVARLRDMSGESPDRSDAMIALGDLLRFKKRYSEAVDAYDGAVKRISTLEARHWSLLYSRGIALERAKRWSRAEADFLKALKFRPDQPFVLNYLGYSWVDKGLNLKRALGMIDKAVQLRPNDGYIKDSLGWAHYRLRAFDRAVTHLERAVELSSQDATINDHLGDAYWQVGRRYEARFQWRRALSLGPEPGDVPLIEKKLAEGLGGTGTKHKSSGAATNQRGG
ncbi:MAG: tetratricopeptide (TPR) repeat protein [Alphaproteobacteria bacterium]|jgi:tetratricopeptide (TPR) repeat protein